MDRHAISIAVLGLGAIVFLGYLLAGLFRRTRVPDVLLLTLLGIALGPDMAGWVDTADFGKAGPVFTSLALIVLLFDGGFHLPLSAMRQGLAPVLALTLLMAAATAAVAALVAYPIFGDWPRAIFAGLALANCSAAVILPVTRSLALGAQVTAALVTESVVSDILCIVGALGVLGWMAGRGASPGDIALGLGTHVVVSAVMGVAAGVLWRLVMGWVDRIPHAMLAEFAFVFVLYGVCELLHGSGPAAVLVCALVIANFPTAWLENRTPKNWPVAAAAAHAKTTLFSEVASLVKVFFFIYLGLSIRIGDWRAFLPALLVVGTIGLLRVPLVRWFLPRACTRDEAFVAASLAPKGLVSAVVALLPVQEGLAGAKDIQDFVFPVILVSLVASALLIPTQGSAWMRRQFAKKLFPQHVIKGPP